MEIYFIRHGETDYNKARLFYGSADVSINQNGILQAAKLQEKLQACHALPVVTSTLVRTQETARLIFPKAEIFPNQAFNEKAFGQWEGLNADQIAAQYPADWEAWLAAPFAYTPPDAEAFSVFKQRVLLGMDQLLKAEKSCVFVGHLGVIRLLFNQWFPELVFWDIQLDQGCYTKLSYQNQRMQKILWNV